MSFFVFLVMDALSNYIRVFLICWLQNFGDWSCWEQHQYKGLITLGKYIFRHRFLCVFVTFLMLFSTESVFHICQFWNFDDWSLYWKWCRGPITLCIFRHKFLCDLCHYCDAIISNGKIFHISWLLFWDCFLARFGPVLPYFQSLTRLQPCYTANSWYVHDSETLERKITT